ncbi:MAG: hypothetical protein EWV73_11895 [Microcystis wesenbergii Mw_QC_B_20070930_S4D]|nr:MAG: hypothetical protein EWV73_11895 [Microcystis wesenbergii Mw_QC_B_20070930_S4D]
MISAERSQESDVSFQFTDYCLLFTGRLRRAFGNTEKRCGNGVYTDSFFSKIVLKVFASKHFTIL